MFFYVWPEWMFSALLASEKCDQTVVKSHLRNEDKCSLNMSKWRSFIQAWSLWRYNNCTHDLLAPTCHWLKSYYLNLGYEVHCIQHIKTYCEMSHYIISMIVSPWLHYCQSFTLEPDICEVFICSINIIHPSTLLFFFFCITDSHMQYCFTIWPVMKTKSSVNKMSFSWNSDFGALNFPFERC